VSRSKSSLRDLTDEELVADWRRLASDLTSLMAESRAGIERSFMSEDRTRIAYTDRLVKEMESMTKRFEWADREMTRRQLRRVL
jgi:hypothetical protein